MRLALAGLATLFALAAPGCGSTQRECFECGLTDEWARAEQEELDANITTYRQELTRVFREGSLVEVEALERDIEDGVGPRVQGDRASATSGGPYQPDLLTELGDVLATTTGDDAELDAARGRVFRQVAVRVGHPGEPVLEECAGVESTQEVCSAALGDVRGDP